jgi:hypothetical protein
MNAKVMTQGRFPRCIGTHTVALFDPKTGHVHHLHHAFIFEGPRPSDAALEAVARRNAAHPRFGETSSSLEALHLHDAPLTRGPHRVDPAQRKLVPAGQH